MIEEFPKFKNINKNIYKELNDIWNYIIKNVINDFYCMKQSLQNKLKI